MMPFQKKELIEAVVMEEGNSPERRWEDLDINILVKILESFNLFQLISVIPQVCRAWQLACSDQRLWKTLDLSVLRSNFIRTTAPPYVYVDSPSREKLTRLLKICLNLSRGNILTLIFHYNLYVDDNQLTYTAERCPRLKRLVMPAWDKLEKPTIRSAIGIWKDLESLTMPSLEKPADVIKKIARNCKNFSELKIMGPCEMLFASTLVSFLPNLEVLSVRCTVLCKPALVIILEGLKTLKVLNISHCIITEDPPPAPMKILTKLDKSILEKASRLDKFLTCMSDSCITCQRTRNDEGLMRWYKYKDLWKVDEIMVTTKDFEEQMQPPVQLGEISEEELMGLIQRRWQSRVRSIIFLREGVFMMPFQKQEKIEAVVMEGDSPVRRWEDLDIDILVKILQSFDLFQLISVIPQVCRAWQLACSDQLLWKTLDLLVLQSNFVRISAWPYVYVDSPSREKLTHLLKICLNLSVETY